MEKRDGQKDSEMGSIALKYSICTHYFYCFPILRRSIVEEKGELILNEKLTSMEAYGGYK